MKYKLVFLTLCLLCIGFAVGHYTGSNYGYNCPKDLTPVLAECDRTAMFISRELTETGWELRDCSDRLEGMNKLLTHVMLGELLRGGSGVYDAVETRPWF